VTINGTYLSPAGSPTTLVGVINNNSLIEVAAAAGFNSTLLIGANTTLQGTGAVDLQSVGTSFGFIEESGTGVTLTNKSTIEGVGIIGNGGLALSNATGGTLLANVSGGVLTMNGSALTNRGTIQVENGSVLDVTPNLNQVAGQTVIDFGGTLEATSIAIKGGTLKVDGFLDPAAIEIFAGGLLEGKGAILGNVESSGTTLLGDGPADPGQLLELGDFAQISGGALTEVIDSTSVFGSLEVTGDVSLDGAVRLDLNGYTPMDGDHFDLINGFTDEAIGAVTLPSHWSLVVDGFGIDQIDLVYSASSTPPPVAEPSDWLDVVALAVLALPAPFVRRARPLPL
jgi:hypothetical protein